MSHYETKSPGGFQSKPRSRVSGDPSTRTHYGASRATTGHRGAKRPGDPRLHSSDYDAEPDEIPCPLEYIDEGPVYPEFTPVEPKMDTTRLPNFMEMASPGLSALLGLGGSNMAGGLGLGGLAGLGLGSQHPAAPHPPPRRRLDEATLNKIISIKLEETPTQTHLYMPSHIAAPKDEEATFKRNEAYRALLERRKEKDKYSSRFAQTLTVSQRGRQTQTPITRTRAMGTQATTWSLYDEIEGDASTDVAATTAGNTMNNAARQDLGALNSARFRAGAKAMSAAARPVPGGKALTAADLRNPALDSRSGIMNANSTSNAAASHSTSLLTSTTVVAGGKSEAFRGVAPAGSDRVRSQVLGLVPAYLRVTQLPAFAQALRVMEAAVVQTFAYPQQLLYRSLISQADMAKLAASTTNAGEGEAGANATGSNTTGSNANGTGLGAASGSGATNSTTSATGSVIGNLATNSGTSSTLGRNTTRRREGKDRSRGGASSATGSAGTAGVAPTTSSNPNDRQIRLLWNLAPPATFNTATAQPTTSMSNSGSNKSGISIPPGLQVTCMAWNQQVPDLLAIGYGSTAFGQQGSGAICFWSLSNPTHPVRIYNTRRGVTALEFSPNAFTAPGGIFHMQAVAGAAAEEQRRRNEGDNPNDAVAAAATAAINAAARAAAAEVAACGINLELGHLLAAGFSDGSVAVYDVREPHGRPAMQSIHPNSHRESVWSVRWTAAAGSRREPQLVTISSDGSVRLWQVERNFSSHEVIELKRVNVNSRGLPAGQGVQSAGQGSGDGAGSGSTATTAVANTNVNSAASSRVAVGLCLDVPLDDPTQYYVGTESGLIHRCSVSYNEQVLDNYTAHTGPVYQIRCSPFLPSYFLSCSADWTCQLWHQKSTTPVITFFLSQPDSMLGVEWSPTNSCVFLSLHRQGHLDLWDLSYSAVEPAVRFSVHSAGRDSVQGSTSASGSSTSGTGSSTSSSTTLASTQSQSQTQAQGSQQAQSQVTRVPTCASFAPNASVVVVGCSDGSAMLLHISGVDLSFERVLSKAAEQARLLESVGKHNEQSGIAAAAVAAASSTAAGSASLGASSTNLNDMLLDGLSVR